MSVAMMAGLISVSCSVAAQTFTAEPLQTGSTVKQQTSMSHGGQPVNLLPQPQQIRIGAAKVSLCKLEVRPPENATPEDLFALQELQAAISKNCGQVANASNLPNAAIRLRRTRSVDPLPLPGETPGPDSRESYRIVLDPKGGEITAPSTAGLFYAAQTFKQLIQGAGTYATVPEVDIHDWPAFAYRGTMMDVSHGPLPTEEEIKRQLDFLSLWKTNQYYLYSEASIELEGYPLLNPPGRYTKDQVRRIIAYGKQRHIDVIPFVELYGHIHDLLRIEQYSKLGTFPHGPEFDPLNPELAPLLDDWAKQISELFPSPFVHIGFDETWQLEMAAQKAGVSPAELFSQQMSKVVSMFQKRGKTVMAWADIIVQYPDVVKRLPKGLIPVAWDYDAHPDIKKWIDPLVAQGLPHFVTTGVANWNQIAIDFSNTFDNIDNFVLAARKSRALGVINSVWLDSSYGLTRSAYPALAYGAVAPWQSAAIEQHRFFANYATIQFPGSSAGHIAKALEALNRSQVLIQEALGGQTYYEMWESPFAKRRLDRTTKYRPTLIQARLAAEDAETELSTVHPSPGTEFSIEGWLFLARMLDYAAYRYLTAQEIAESWESIRQDFRPQKFWVQFDSEVTYQSHSRLVDLMDRITELRDSYRELWLQEYTPYRLATTLGRFDAEYQYWLHAQSVFRNLSQTLNEEHPLPPLEEVIQ